MNFCRCGKQTKDAEYTCNDCLNDLARDLGECTWLEEQLDISITRQRGAATTGGANSGEKALPWHDKASEVKRDLHATLASWVRICVEEHVKSAGPSTSMPTDTIGSMSRWLLCRVDGLAFNEAGYEAVRDVARATERARNIVFYKPEARVYLAPCGEAGCDGDVYADRGAIFGTCEVCATAFSVEARKKWMNELLDDRLFTAAEFAQLASTYLGLHVSRERVRKQINSWHKKKIITSGTGEGEAARFRYATVRVMLYQQFGEKEAG
jgi:hypothetical protein